ncbi:SAVED domain-containing protein [Lipingzhangella sp. LS1_29]|uniref:SAVED domain-containing protein n=1 Tax=Lipingzhangella rawalii TaxID=2055835 RepID=A0ABU2H5Y5_9ACTN|nr:SAVED domain-containing protein [Lipingzhangella rawalii]MDS1270703.1 SAVED domain-containing protein [Lipingzhangella rawalii]
MSTPTDNPDTTPHDPQVGPGPPSSGVVDRIGPIFISYRHSDGRSVAEEITWLLRSAGLLAWLDTVNLPPGPFTTHLEQALTNGLSGAVLIVTADIEHSTTVREQELPRLRQLAGNPNFGFAVANAVAPDGEAMDLAAPDRLLGLEQGVLRNYMQYNAWSGDQQLTMVDQLLKHRIRQLEPPVPESEGSNERLFTIAVQTREEQVLAEAYRQDLHIHLQPPESQRKVPPRAALERLQRTLPRTSAAVARTGATTVRLSGGIHLSVSLAIGAALPETLIGRMELVGPRQHIWSSEAAVDDPHDHDIVCAEVPETVDSRAGSRARMAVFVTMAPNPDQSPFPPLLREADPPFTHAVRISLDPLEQFDPREAGRLSWTVANRLKAIATQHGDENGPAEVHLAYHGPTALAALIGRYLNTLRTVVYEYRPAEYVPMMTLDPGVTDGPIVQVHPAG